MENKEPTRGRLQPHRLQKEVSAIAKKGFFSRFLGGKGSKEQNEPSKSPPEAPVEETPEPKQRPLELLLPAGHFLNLLWDLYAQTRPDTGYPVLRFDAALPPHEDPDKQVDELLFSPEEAEHELPRLAEFVTRLATKRFVKQKQTNDAPAPDLDAEVHVFLTSRRMTAWLLVLPPSGTGIEVDELMLTQALKGAGVTEGIDAELLRELPQSPERYFHLYLAARGTPPVHGRDGYVIERFSRSVQKNYAEDETGRVDFASLELFQNAKEGEVICDIFQPVPGTDGKTVLGQPISCHVARPAQVPKGRNTEINKDGTALVATREGHVEFSGRSFQIRPVLEIPGNVDYSTGNLNCMGDIHIHGDVISGFAIRATGSITVDGSVESCNIEAGGDLILRNGVQGNGQAVLRAHRSIYARYVESSNIYVREGLETECIINCNVYSDKDVTVRSGRGTIIGGQIHAARQISANTVGARSEAQTCIFLGGTPCEDSEREDITKDIDRLKQELERLELLPDSPAKQRQMAKARLQISADQMKLQQFDKEMKKLREEHAAPGGLEPQHGQMTCSKLYPGTEITIGSAFLKVTHETNMCTTSVYKGEIILI